MKIKFKLKILITLLLILGIPIVLATMQKITITPVSPTNNSNYTTGQVLLNVSVSPASNTTECKYKIGYDNGTTSSWSGIMTNGTDTNTTFWNSSAFTPIVDSTFGSMHNVTFSCYNGTAATNQTAQSFFGYDSTNPHVWSLSTAIGNHSAVGTGSNVSITFNVSDRYRSTCSVKVYDYDGTKESEVTGTFIDDLAENTRCLVTISPTYISKNGKYTLEPNAEDSLGNSNVSDTNMTVTAYQLKTGWNLISIPENITLDDIANSIDNISYVSFFDNNVKTYTTYTVGSNTNANYMINATNATYVYVDEDILLLREHYAVTTNTNQTLVYNSTTGGWNQVSLMNRTNLNETFYNTTEGGLISVYNTTGLVDIVSRASSANITYVSYYNATLGKYCTARRGYTATSCTGINAHNVTDIYIDRGQAIWILVDADIIYDRRGWA